jgi:hypothetical protein
MRKYGLRITNGRFSVFSARGEWRLSIFAGDGFGSIVTIRVLRKLTLAGISAGGGCQGQQPA